MRARDALRAEDDDDEVAVTHVPSQKRDGLWTGLLRERVSTMSCRSLRRASLTLLVTLSIACGGGEGGPSDSGVDALSDAAADTEVDSSYVPEPFEPTAATEAFCGDGYLEVEARIDELLTQLTLREKVSMMHGARPATVDGVWLVEGNEDHGIPGLHMIDGPRGISVFTGETATAFPVGMCRGATWDLGIEERVGAAMGREARSVGADVVLAPTINILRHPRWGRAQETYGEDPMHLGSMGVAYIRGAQSENVIASAKHFAANSIEDTRFEVDVTVDERTLREIYLPHFRRAVMEAQVGSVMSAYNSVNGFFSGENAHLLSEILKDEWQFQGFVESDWLSGTHSTAPAANSGLDIEMPAGVFFSGRLILAVEEGEVSIHVIDRAIRRILRTQFCFELDTAPPIVDASQRETAEHRALALEAAQRGIVLLKNADVGAVPALPIDRAAVTEIVLLGKLADVENIGDSGSSAVESEDTITALEGLIDRAGAVTITHIAEATLDAAAQATVSGADVVVVVAGFTGDDEGEGAIGAGDRESLDMDAEQKALIAAVAGLNDRVVVVLEGGASILMDPWLADVEAVLMAWYPGEEGGHAIADVLFGDVNPSGRLPISFVHGEADLPDFDNTSLAVTYGYYHGYRHLMREGTAALFPFGFGLSYSEFTYDSLDIVAETDGSFTATVDVTNTGTVAGRETVQLYVSAPGSAVDRAQADLRAFAQIDIAPGATEQVVLSVPARDLAYYDVDSSSWVVEHLEYTVSVGPNVRDRPLSAPMTVTTD